MIIIVPGKFSLYYYNATTAAARIPASLHTLSAAGYRRQKSERWRKKPLRSGETKIIVRAYFIHVQCYYYYYIYTRRRSRRTERNIKPEPSGVFYNRPTGGGSQRQPTSVVASSFPYIAHKGPRARRFAEPSLPPNAAATTV